MIFGFGEFELDELRCELRRDGRLIKLEPKVFAVLRHLVCHADRVVSKQELLNTVWPGVHVSESVLSQSVWLARRALGDASTKEVIETAHRRGYRFTAPITTRDERNSSGREDYGVRAGTSLFVGRRAELTRAREWVDAIAHGSGKVIFIAGDAGVGKTRFVEKLLDHARARGYVVAEGRAYEIGGPPFYGAFAEALMRLFATLPPDLAKQVQANGPWRSKLVPPIGDQLAAPPPLPSQHEHWLIWTSVVELLRAAAATQSVVLVLEDLHWADESTVLLLHVIIRQLRELPIALVVTYRDSELGSEHGLRDVLGEAVRYPYVRALALAGLDVESIRELLRTFSSASPPAAVVELIYRWSEGNPFFVQELVKLLNESEQLFDAAGNWRPTITSASPTVPTNVRLTIERRLRRLDTTTRAMLAEAAVIGRQFHFETLERVTSVPADVLLDAIEAAEALKLIARLDAGDFATYQFSHELIWHTCRAQMTPARRQRFHLRVAVVIEDLFPGAEAHTLAVALHYLEAGTMADPQKRRTWFARAGDQAMAEHAFDQAVQFYSATLGLTSAGTLEHAQLLSLIGRAYFRGGDSGEAIHWLERAVAARRALPGHDGAEEEYLAVSWAHAVRGDFVGMRRTLEEGLKLSPRGETEARCRLLASAARCRTMQRDISGADDAIAQAMRMSESTGNPTLRGTVLATKGAHLWAYCEFSSAREVLLEATELLRAGQDLSTLMSCRSDLLITLGYLGRFDEIEEPLAELGAIADRMGDRGAMAMHAFLQAVFSFVHASLVEAHERTEQAVALARSGGFLVLPAALQLLAEVEFATGRWDRIDGLLDEAERLNERMQRPPVRYVGKLSLAVMCALRGDEDRARELLRVAGLPSPPVAGAPTSCETYDAMVTASRLLVALGMGKSAMRYYPSLRAIAQRGARFASVSYPLLERVLGMIAAAAGRTEAARTHYHRALRQAEAIGARKEVALTAHAYGTLLSQSTRYGARSDALIARAFGLYQELNFMVDVGRVWKDHHQGEVEKVVAVGPDIWGQPHSGRAS